MKIINKSIKEILQVIIFQTILYLWLFIFSPSFLIKNTPDEVWITISIIFVITFLIFTITHKVNKARFWFVGIFIMWALVLIYHPKDLYGISDPSTGFDFTSAKFDALIFSIGLFLVQLTIIIAVKIVNKIKATISNRRSSGDKKSQ